MQDVFLGKRLMWTPGTPLRDDTTLKKRLRTPKRKKQPWIEVQDGGTSGLRGARPGVQVKLPVSLSGPTGGGPEPPWHQWRSSSRVLVNSHEGFGRGGSELKLQRCYRFA